MIRSLASGIVGTGSGWYVTAHSITQRKHKRQQAMTRIPRTAPKKGRAKSPPCEVYPSWSEAKFWGFIRSALRSASSRWPPKYECLNAATRPYKGPDKRRKKERQCAHCKKWFATTQTQADHIIPAGKLSSWDDLVPFVQRMFVGVDGFQCLCSTCHNKKTQEERNGKSE